MRTVRVSIQRGLSMPRPSGWEMRSHICPGSTNSGVSISRYLPRQRCRSRAVHHRDVPRGTRPPAIHSRTQRMMSCSIVDDASSSRRGGPISERSWETMDYLEHARTGTSAGGRRRQYAPSLARRYNGRPPASPELVIVDVVTQRDEEPHEELAGHGDFRLGAPAPLRQGAIRAGEL